MLPDPKYVKHCKALVVSECLLCVVFGIAAAASIAASPTPVFMVLFAIGAMCLTLATISTVSSYWRLLLDLSKIKDLQVDYVRLSGYKVGSYAEVHTVTGEVVTFRNIHRVYNKDIDKALIDKEHHILYIPYSANIYVGG
ncbi:MAG: hypothetical protein NC548_10925 [Lachnospiraceae bacterium]|nr:hypothetical protein [Lachnospiraceae bacterium]